MNRVFSHEVRASPVALVLWFVVMHYLTPHSAPETDTANAYRVKLLTCLKSSWLLKWSFWAAHGFIISYELGVFFWICLNTSRDGDENCLAGACFFCQFGWRYVILSIWHTYTAQKDHLGFRLVLEMIKIILIVACVLDGV